MSENDEVRHVTISADPVAAAAGDGGEPQAEEPVEDPYDVENPDEVEPDPGPAPEYTPDFDATAPQDDDADPDAE